MLPRARLRCLLYALLCTFGLAGWQALTVRYNYGGNWTGLYCTGSGIEAIPPELRSENIYIFPNSGYDGQSYHLVAHDPAMVRGFSSLLDDARLRYGRILVPGLAYLLAFGQDRAVDPAYLCVVWVSILLGSYWLGRYALYQGYPAWFALLFALVPAVLISVDRLTVDVALAACVVGFARYTQEQLSWRLYAVLAAAGLVRETGLLLVAAYCISLASERQFRRAAWFATAAIPALSWQILVRFRTPPYRYGFVSIDLFMGMLNRVVRPFPYPFGGPVKALAIGLDLLALAGIALALGWALQRAFARARKPVTIAAYLFALLAITLSQAGAWSEVYAFGRTLTPLVLLSALDGLSIGSLVPALSILAIDPRIGLQWSGQIVNVARGAARLALGLGW